MANISGLNTFEHTAYYIGKKIMDDKVLILIFLTINSIFSSA